MTTVVKPEKRAKVRLVGVDGNAFMLIGVCRQAGKRAGYTPEQITAFQEEAMSGDYDHVIQTCMDWFEVS
jgi:hypothetical protein